MKANTLLYSTVSILFVLGISFNTWAGKRSETDTGKRQEVIKPDPVPNDPDPVQPAAAEKQDRSISKSNVPGSSGRLDPTPVLDPQAGTANQPPLTGTLDEVKRLGSRSGPGQGALDDLPGRDTPLWDPTGGIDPNDPDSFPGQDSDTTVLSPNDVLDDPGGSDRPPDLRNDLGQRAAGWGQSQDSPPAPGYAENASQDEGGAANTPEGDKENKALPDKEDTWDADGIQDNTSAEDDDDKGTSGGGRVGQGDSTPIPEGEDPTSGDPEGPPQIATGDVDPPQDADRSPRGGMVPARGDIDYDEKSVSPSGGISLIHGDVDPPPPEGN